MATKTVFVLREATKERKKPLWFWQMTAIGPGNTPLETAKEAVTTGCQEGSPSSA
jgi:hypothetical protein